MDLLGQMELAGDNDVVGNYLRKAVDVDFTLVVERDNKFFRDDRVNGMTVMSLDLNCIFYDKYLFFCHDYRRVFT